jgi:hypothetical protein
MRWELKVEPAHLGYAGPEPEVLWWSSVLPTSVDGVEFEFTIDKGKRCWRARVCGAGGADKKLGDYRTERLAKAACRRKAGRIVDALKRGIRA